MASVTHGARGRRVQFMADGKRKTIYLGDAPSRVAETVRVRVETILACKASRTPLDIETARWIGEVSPEMRQKLAAAGLIDKTADARNSRLGEFLDLYDRGRADLKRSTHTTQGHTRRNLAAFFGREKELVAIRPCDADDFRVYLKSQGLAENTVRRRLGHCRQFFRAAARRGLYPKTEENPFAHLPTNTVESHDRMQFVERETAEAVIRVCPNAQWRCLVALARYGGLRCPSEPFALKRSAIDWKNKRITVTVPKLHFLPNKATRLIPLFPELVQPLKDAIAEVPDSEWVIGKYRDKQANIVTQLTRLMELAGVEPWLKPWTNLRASRETELVEEYPIHVACAWIGNSPDIAVKHYLMLRPQHFERATGTQNKTQQVSVFGESASQSAFRRCSDDQQNDLPLRKTPHDNAKSSGPRPTPAKRRKAKKSKALRRRQK